MEDQVRSRSEHIPLLALGAVVALVYAPVLRLLVSDWIRDSNYHHAFLVPPAAGFLWLRNRPARRTGAPTPSVWGLAGIVGALGLLVLGTAAAEVFTQRISLLVLIASCLLFLSGTRRLKEAAFPLAFLLLAIPLPYVLYYGLTLPMQGLAAKAAVAGLRVLGVPALLAGNAIHLPQANLEVAEACSGVRSLYAFLAAGALMARSVRIPTWARLIVFAAAVPLTIAGNAARVWGSGLAVWLRGPSAAAGAAHEMFGVLVFAFTVCVFLLIKKGAASLWSSSATSWSSSS
jgi:exosortase